MLPGSGHLRPDFYKMSRRGGALGATRTVGLLRGYDRAQHRLSMALAHGGSIGAVVKQTCGVGKHRASSPIQRIIRNWGSVEQTAGSQSGQCSLARISRIAPHGGNQGDVERAGRKRPQAAETPLQVRRKRLVCRCEAVPSRAAVPSRLPRLARVATRTVATWGAMQVVHRDGRRGKARSERMVASQQKSGGPLGQQLGYCPGGNIGLDRVIQYSQDAAAPGEPAPHGCSAPLEVGISAGANLQVALCLGQQCCGKRVWAQVQPQGISGKCMGDIRSQGATVVGLAARRAAVHRDKVDAMIRLRREERTQGRVGGSMAHVVPPGWSAQQVFHISL